MYMKAFYFYCNGTGLTSSTYPGSCLVPPSVDQTSLGGNGHFLIGQSDCHDFLYNAGYGSGSTSIVNRHCTACIRAACISELYLATAPPPVRNAVSTRSEHPRPSLPQGIQVTNPNLMPSGVPVTSAPTVTSAPVTSAATATGSGARPETREIQAVSGGNSTPTMNTLPTDPQGATGPAVPVRPPSDSVTITSELFQQLLDAAAAQRRDQPPH